MVVAYRTKYAPQPAMRTYDGTDLATSLNSRYHIQMLEGAAKAGLLMYAHGVPTYSATTMRPGTLIVDTSNNDLYVVDAGAVNKITDS